MSEIPGLGRSVRDVSEALRNVLLSGIEQRFIQEMEWLKGRGFTKEKILAHMLKCVPVVEPLVYAACAYYLAYDPLADWVQRHGLPAASESIRIDPVQPIQADHPQRPPGT